MNYHTIYRDLVPEGDMAMNDYRDICRVHIDSALTEEVKALKLDNVGAYYDAIFDVAIDSSLLHGATIEEAIWSASLVCGEY